jgi:uncharacterized protein (DUF488 family)
MDPRRRKRRRGNGNVHPEAPAVQQLPLPPPFALDGASDHGAQTSPVPIAVFTIGHSNHDAATFLGLLTQHGLRTVVDVRSAPYSRYVPHFSRSALARLLEDADVGYVWAGDLLGGRPDDPECYDGEGAVDYAAIARQSRYLEGLRHLLAHAAASPTVILCSEEDPRRCHRHKLIEPSLREREAVVLHIRRDGSLETIAPGASDAGATTSAQLAFAEFAA